MVKIIINNNKIRLPLLSKVLNSGTVHSCNCNSNNVSYIYILITEMYGSGSQTASLEHLTEKEQAAL